MNSGRKSGKIAVLSFVFLVTAQASYAGTQTEEKLFPPSDQVAGDVKKIEADRSDNPAPTEAPARPDHNYTHGHF